MGDPKVPSPRALAVPLPLLLLLLLILLPSGCLCSPRRTLVLLLESNSTVAAAPGDGPWDPLPPVPPPPSPPLVVLAPGRSFRVNPNQNFGEYKGGWDLLSTNYWASLAWSGAPAVGAGAVWLVLGLLLGSTLLCCLCCVAPHARPCQAWQGQRSLGLDVLLLVLGACALILCIGGFAALCMGQVSLWSQADTDVQLVFQTVKDMTRLLRQVANTLQAAASVAIGQITLSPEQQQMIVKAVQDALAAASSAEAQVTATQNTVNSILQALAIAVVVLSSFFLLLILLAAICSCTPLVYLSCALISLVWLLCFFSLSMVALSGDAYSFLGDTQAAMQQVQANPSAPSAMSTLIPCTDQAQLNFTEQQTRKTAHDLVDLVNTAWLMNQIPPLLVGGVNVTRVCNPFAGEPSYLPAGPCPNGAPTVLEVLQSMNMSACARYTRLCSSLSARVPQSELVALSLAAVLQRLYPDLGPMVSCKYVADAAAAILDHSEAYYNSVYLAWVGYVILSAGAMLLAVLLPFYIFRALRTVPRQKSIRFDKDQDQEDEVPKLDPMAAVNDSGRMPQFSDTSSELLSRKSSEESEATVSSTTSGPVPNLNEIARP